MTTGTDAGERNLPSPAAAGEGPGVGANGQWHLVLQKHLAKAKKPLLVILGPTASGKTAFSIEMAKVIEQLGQQRVMVSPSNHGTRMSHFDELSVTHAEIINADSRQLYKYMDIGTAKITKKEMGNIQHYLFSVLDPKEKVTVGWYKKTAEKVIDDILARGNVPILVGGSMLYISAVTDGYIFTGRGGKRSAPIPYDLLIFGIRRPRGELVRRIEERTKTLLGMSFAPHHDKQQNPQTWLQEVSWLLKNGYTMTDPGMESHGYREIVEWILNGRMEEDLSPLINRINAATRQYAKRQMTWWKHDARIHWIHHTVGKP